MLELHLSDRQTLLPLTEEWLHAILLETLHCEEVHAAELSLVLVDNPTMRRLNRKHLQHDYATDVLSFLLDRQDPEEPVTSSSKRSAGCRLSGELIVSTEMARDMAPQYDWPTAAELALYMVHGLLHICGYDDLTSTERPLMRERERVALARWGWEPQFRPDLPGELATTKSSASLRGDLS